ncbi:hypothetical protein Tco_1242257 [Tanacetum coccineum]
MITLHTASDDSLLGALKYVSKTKERQAYGALIPKEMINEDILNSTTYQTYFAYDSGAKEPKKARKFKKHASPKQKNVPVSPKEPIKKPTKAKKDVPSTKKPTTKPKPTKKKAPVKADRGKGLNVLSKVALSKAAQLKEVIERSKKDFHISHASGSGDGIDFESGVPDEKQRKISGTNEGTGTKPGVPDVPKYDYESEKESWGNSREEEDDDDDEDDSEDESNDDNNDDDGDYNDDEDKNDDDNEAVSDRTESDRIKIPDLNQPNKENEEEEEEEYIDERVHTPEDYELTDEEENANNAKEENEVKQDDVEELYRDVNVNLRKEDAEMTEADQGGVDQKNVSQELGFKQVKEDAHVTLTVVHDTQKTEGPMQSSSVLSDFTDKLLNFENTSPADNEISSLMDTTVRHEEPSSQTSSLFTVPIMVIPEIMSTFTTTIPPPPPSFNPLLQQATTTPTPTALEATTLFPTLPDFSSLFRFNERVTNLEKDLSLETYGKVFTLKINRDDKDKDQDPSAGSGRGTKRGKSSKDAESSRDLKSKESKSTSTSKGQQNQEFDAGNNDEQPDDKATSKVDWFKKPEQPPTPNPDWNKRQHVDFKPSETWISNLARAEKPPSSFDELMDTPIDFLAFVMNRLNITNLTQELLVGPTLNLLKSTCKSRTELEYHFEECYKATAE